MELINTGRRAASGAGAHDEGNILVKKITLTDRSPKRVKYRKNGMSTGDVSSWIWRSLDTTREMGDGASNVDQRATLSTRSRRQARSEASR